MRSPSHLNVTDFVLSLFIIFCTISGGEGREIHSGNHSFNDFFYRLFFGNSARLFSRRKVNNYTADPVIYNRSLALYLVNHAAAAYTEDFPKLSNWSCSHCSDIQNFRMVDLIIDADRLLLAYIGIDEQLDSIIISFRGTREKFFINWMADLYFFPLNLSYPGVADAFVHYGFYYSYHNTTLRDKIVENVFSILRDHNNSRFDIKITGHSLGAAMASLCALDLTVNFGLSDIEVITFGQPRVGNAKFAQFYNEKVPKSIRMTHAHDLVVHLPPKTFHGNKAYHHVATEVWIHKDRSSSDWPSETEKICDSSGEDPACSRSVRGSSINDHFLYLGVDVCSAVGSSVAVFENRAIV